MSVLSRGYKLAIASVAVVLGGGTILPVALRQGAPEPPRPPRIVPSARHYVRGQLCPANITPLECKARFPRTR